MLGFRLLAQDGAARACVVETAHGAFETPAFMPVGTLGAVKGLLPSQLRESGAQIVLGNALHLAWRPGEARVQRLGGLHRFGGWDGPILTDSGGFQIFSLPGLRKITEEGAAFASPVDGAVRLFTPESVVDLECALGADLIMPLDHLKELPCPRSELVEAVDRSIRWAERALRRKVELERPEIALFGIVQGGTDRELRTRSAEGTCKLEFPGFALGGFSVGEETAAMHEAIAFSAPLLPAGKPRYLMGMGTPPDLLHAVGSGMDMFDCTLPTRNGRNAQAFTSEGPLRLRNARFAEDERPLDPRCACQTCRTVSRAFLRHLFLAREMNAAILTSLHNVSFYLELMRGSREAIRAGRFEAFRSEFLSRYREGGAGADEADEAC
ncbi:MAG: tRNA guanosine(34) transglycosylase Tgt [Planctomycetota bacterium]|nr:tRNA guanosine(34) transglycosylase Tgt [Planctomycetota bacterium]